MVESDSALQRAMMLMLDSVASPDLTKTSDVVIGSSSANAAVGDVVVAASWAFTTSGKARRTDSAFIISDAWIRRFCCQSISEYCFMITDVGVFHLKSKGNE